VSDNAPRGAPPYQELPEAYRELLQGLFYAQEVFKTKGDAGREGVRIACHAVARFVAVRNENPELAVPFLALRQALLDWERGVDTELLSKEPKERSRSGQAGHLKAIASACLEVLVHRKMPLTEAAGYVARHVQAWPGIGNRAITATTVENWRTEQRAAAPSAKTPFQIMVQDLLSRKDPQAEVERLLREGPPGIPKS
jgi:hypothetical protein